MNREEDTRTGRSRTSSNTKKKAAVQEDNLLRWLGKNIIAAIVLVLILVILAGLGLKVLTRHGQTIEVPDFTNMKVSEAVYEAKAAGLRAEVVDSVYIRRMGRGLVYSQNPKPGGKVKGGRRIHLTINSVTPKKVQVPNLVGLSMRQAKAELLSRGLALGNLIYVNDMATNYVIRQFRGRREIRPGTMVESGCEIDLEVGLNSESNQTNIPDFRGMKYLRAVDAVHDNSLNVAKLVFDSDVRNYGDSLDAVVYKQSPGASKAPILMGSDVTLYLSKDPLKK